MKNLIVGFCITVFLYSFVIFAKSVLNDEAIKAVLMGVILMIQISTIIPILKRSE